MLEIVQAKDYKNYSNLFEKLKIADEIVSVVEALDKNQVIGYGIYHFNDKEVILDYVDSNNDNYLYDGIVRSILYLAMTNNINRALFNILDTETIKKLGFINENNNCIENITEFMDKCKNCKNHN